MTEDLIEAVNETGTINNKIQLNHFELDQNISQQDHFGTFKDDNQEQYVSIKNSDHESDDSFK